MNHHSEQAIAAELERQQLIKQAHSLVAAIASRPGATKLLRAVVPMLQMYAAYKTTRRHRGRGAESVEYLRLD